MTVGGARIVSRAKSAKSAEGLALRVNTEAAVELKRFLTQRAQRTQRKTI